MKAQLALKVLAIGTMVAGLLHHDMAIADGIFPMRENGSKKSTQTPGRPLHSEPLPPPNDEDVAAAAAERRREEAEKSTQDRVKR